MNVLSAELNIAIAIQIYMIKEYLARLELRMLAVEKILGDVSEFKEAEINDVREGISNTVSKLHKDNSRKFERIKKVFEKHLNVADMVPTQDKITLLHAELEEIQPLAAQLDRIQKLTPYLSTDQYLKHRQNFRHLHLFRTCSQLEGSSLSISAKEINNESLPDLRSHHRRSMNELAELNRQVVHNLAAKLHSLENRKLKETGIQ